MLVSATIALGVTNTATLVRPSEAPGPGIGRGGGFKQYSAGRFKNPTSVVGRLLGDVSNFKFSSRKISFCGQRPEGSESRVCARQAKSEHPNSWHAAMCTFLDFKPPRAPLLLAEWICRLQHVRAWGYSVCCIILYCSNM